RGDIDAACARASLPPWSTTEIARRARRALEGVSRAQIGTLHGYAATIVRAYALEAGLSPRFEIAGEDQPRARLEELIVRVLEARGASVRELVDAAGGVDRLVAQISAALVKLDEDGRGAETLELPESDAAALDATMHAFVEHAGALVREPKYEESALRFL